MKSFKEEKCRGNVLRPFK